MDFIESDIRENLNALNSGQATFESVIEVLWYNLCSAAKMEKDPAVKTLITEIMTKYRDGLLNEESLIECLKKISTGDLDGVYTYLAAYSEEVASYDDGSYGGYYGGGGSSKSSSSSNDDDIIVDIESDLIMSIVSQYSEVESELNDIKMASVQLVADHVSAIKAIIETGKTEVSGILEDIRGLLIEVLNINADTDEHIKDIEYSNITFTDIGQVMYDRSQNSNVIEMTEEVFKKLNYEVDKYGNVKIKIDGKECKYNLKNHKFSVDGNEAFETYFYIPKDALAKGNASKLNTYTFFTNSDYKNLMNKQLLDSTPKSELTNSVLVRITKYPSTQRFSKYDETALATKFINQVAQTDLKSGCHNIIGGDSVYGTHSLRIAAQNGKLYDTVYSVNSAVIVTDENGIKNYKTQFENVDELMGLNGKRIFLFSTSGDENLNHGAICGATWSKKCDYADSYACTGYELLCKYCKKADVHIIYNEKGHKELVDILKNIAGKYSNCSYDAKYWNSITDSSYESHTSGNNIIYDLLKWDVTSTNPNTQADKV